MKSGEQSYFSDKQSIPTLSLGPNGTVGAGKPIDVGLTVTITPTIIPPQDVDLSVDVDQTKSIGQGAGGVPVTANHKAKTRLYLKSGEVAAMTQMTDQEMNTSFNRDDANLGSFASTASGPQTKPLFTLQRSKNMAKNRSQTVIFVTPQIIDNAAEGTEDLKKNFRMKLGS